MLELSLVVSDCSKDWGCGWRGMNPVASHRALAARSFPMIRVLVETELGISHGGEVQRPIWSYQIHIFFFFPPAQSGSEWHCVPVGNWPGIFWTAVVPWADSPTVFDSEGTQQSDR